MKDSTHLMKENRKLPLMFYIQDLSATLDLLLEDLLLQQLLVLYLL
jgi:hypothetical protein